MGTKQQGLSPHNPRSPPRTAPEPLLEWQGEVGLPPTRCAGKGWGLQGHPHLQGLAGRLTGPSTFLWLVCSQLIWVTARSRDAREGGPLLRSPHDPSCPLLPSRVSRVSLPPATKARTMTVTHTPVPPGKLTRGLEPGWGLVTWCFLPSPSKMPVPRRGTGAQHEPHGLCKQHGRRGLPLKGGGRV